MAFPSIVSSTTDGELAIRAVSLTKSYGWASSAVHALRGVNLEIRRGERIALLGKSGSGKSTLLNLIGGLDRPTSGSIDVAGFDLSRLSGKKLAQHRLHTVGMIFQAFNLIASRTALQNVELPMIFAGQSAAARRSAACQALQSVGLEARLQHLPAELSGGEQQRVAIARALVNRPQILLADEPTGNLDTETAVSIIDLLSEQIRERNTTVILVTHDAELARRFAHRVVYMKDGMVE